METLNFDGKEIDITGIDGIIGVFSSNESLETLQELHERHGVEIHPVDGAIILVRKPQ